MFVIKISLYKMFTIINASSTTSGKEQNINNEILNYLLHCISSIEEKNNLAGKKRLFLPKKFKIDNKNIKDGKKFTKLIFFNEDYKIILKGKFISESDEILSKGTIKILESNIPGLERTNDKIDIVYDFFNSPLK